MQSGARSLQFELPCCPKNCDLLPKPVFPLRFLRSLILDTILRVHCIMSCAPRMLAQVRHFIKIEQFRVQTGRLPINNSRNLGRLVRIYKYVPLV